MPGSRLKDRYTKIDLPTARTQWKRIYEKGSVITGVARQRHHFILTGLILPVWGVVSQ